MTLENTFVLIDAGYLNEISKHLGEGKPISIDLNQFAITLAKKQNLWVKGVFYFTAPPYQSPISTIEEMERRRNYDKFISKLRRIPNFIVREGRCQKKENDYCQKGVDTLLTMELMTLSQKPEVKTLILVSCDTDFVPILNQVREKGIKIVLYYYTDKQRKSKFSMSNHILTACDKTATISKEHFEESLLNKQNFH